MSISRQPSTWTGETCIAVLCSASNVVQVKALIAKITSNPLNEESDGTVSPWRIDNRYYTADVHLQTFENWDEQSEVSEPHAGPTDWTSCSAVVYAISHDSPLGVPGPLRALSDGSTPRQPEVLLALLLDPPDAKSTLCQSAALDEIEDTWDAAGFEVLDLRGRLAETDESKGKEGEDDPDDIDPFERMKEALQTIIWPNLERKPRMKPPKSAPEDSVPLLTGAAKVLVKGSSLPPFAVGGKSDEAVDLRTGPDGMVWSSIQGEVKRSLWCSGSNNTGKEEQEKLDAWLDSADDGSFPKPSRCSALVESGTSQTFDDDFSAFIDGSAQTPFVTSTFSTDGTTPDSPTIDALVDPTNLLLQLSSIRDELGLVQDEDERRNRAGREVTKVLASLGFGDLGDLSDED